MIPKSSQSHRYSWHNWSPKYTGYSPLYGPLLWIWWRMIIKNLQKKLSFFLFLFVIYLFFTKVPLEEKLSNIWDEYCQPQENHQHGGFITCNFILIRRLEHFLHFYRNINRLKTKPYLTINFVWNLSFHLKKNNLPILREILYFWVKSVRPALFASQPIV